MNDNLHWVYPVQVGPDGDIFSAVQESDLEIATSMATTILWPLGYRELNSDFGCADEAFLDDGPDIDEIATRDRDQRAARDPDDRRSDVRSRRVRDRCAGRLEQRREPPAVSLSVPYVYQQAALVTDATTIKGQMVDYLTGYMPAGWRLVSGNPLDLALEAVAIQAAIQADVAQTKLDSDFRYFGSLVGIRPIDAVPANATATFTVQDAAGYRIEAGDVIAYVDSNGQTQGFDLAADIVIPAGSTTGTGIVVAEQAGTAQNGLGGSAATLIQVEPWVTAATMTVASQGIDAELDAVFLDRLTETLGVLTPIPVLGTNFAVLARSVAGVYRAAGVDLLKPGPPYDPSGTAENDAAVDNVTVAVTDINGQPVGAVIRMAVQAYLNTLREQNFQTWVVDAQYNQIDVSAMTVYAWPGWDPTALGATVTAAIQALLSPATFATDSSGVAGRWANVPVVHSSDLIKAAFSASPGVRNVSPPTFGIHGGTMGTADVTLGAGSAIPALPTAGTVNVTVVPTTA